MVFAASFQPPALPGTDAAWVLLDTWGYIADNGNATRVEALTSTGQPIAVSFFAAEPPGVSHFCVHCPGLKNADFAREPRVVYSADDLALLTLSLTDVQRLNYDIPHEEYFLYRARRHGRPQSLEPLPGLHAQLWKLTALPSISIVPCGDESEHFVLAALGLTFIPGKYEFHVFRSEPGTWTEKVVLLGQAELGPNMVTICPDKVIVLGGGEIGWVGLWQGILVCNPLDEDPVFRVIPLPKVLPANHAYCHDNVPVKQFRDVVVCVDGSIKMVELEFCRRRIVHEIPDVSKLEVLHDEDLTLGEAVQTKDTYEYLGWRMLTWNRTVSSDCWRRGSLVHVDDIIVDDPRHSVLLPKFVEKDARKGLLMGFPTLGMDAGDVVYLKTKVNTKDRNAWSVAIDVRKKTVVGVAPFSDERSMYSNPNYITSALPKYLSKVTKMPYALIDAEDGLPPFKKKQILNKV